MSYRCRQCGYVFYGAAELAAHQLSVHALGAGRLLERSLGNLYEWVGELVKRVDALEEAVGELIGDQVDAEERDEP